MYPELVTRPDLDVFLPPISSATVYIIGPMEYISDPTKKLSLRYLFIILLIYDFVNLLFCYFIILLFFNLLFYYFVILLFC
jgi:hypothetical protein